MSAAGLQAFLRRFFIQWITQLGPVVYSQIKAFYVGVAIAPEKHQGVGRTGPAPLVCPTNRVWVTEF